MLRPTNPHCVCRITGVEPGVAQLPSTGEIFWYAVTVPSGEAANAELYACSESPGILSGVPKMTHISYLSAADANSKVMGLSVVSAWETAIRYAGEFGSLDDTYPVNAISGKTIILTPAAEASSM